MSEDIIKISATTNAEQIVECQSGDLKFLFAQTESEVTNVEMNPMQMLLTALGACECYVARGLAKLNNIDLQDIKIDIQGEKAPRNSEDKGIKVGFSKISQKFYIKANNTEEEIKNFIALVERKCPVHATMDQAPNFETEVFIG